jgi:hypothetical protein
MVLHEVPARSANDSLQSSEPDSCAGNFFGYNSDLESWFFSETETETKKAHVHDLHGEHDA